MGFGPQRRLFGHTGPHRELSALSSQLGKSLPLDDCRFSLSPLSRQFISHERQLTFFAPSDKERFATISGRVRLIRQVKTLRGIPFLCDQHNSRCHSIIVCLPVPQENCSYANEYRDISGRSKCASSSSPICISHKHCPVMDGFGQFDLEMTQGYGVTFEASLAAYKHVVLAPWDAGFACLLFPRWLLFSSSLGTKCNG